METSVIIGVLGLALSAAAFFVGRGAAKKGEGREAGEMAMNIKHLMADVAEIKKSLSDNVLRLEGRIDQLSANVSEVAAIAVRAESVAKAANTRIDRIDK